MKLLVSFHMLESVNGKSQIKCGIQMLKQTFYCQFTVKGKMLKTQWNKYILMADTGTGKRTISLCISPPFLLFSSCKLKWVTITSLPSSPIRKERFEKKRGAWFRHHVKPWCNFDSVQHFSALDTCTNPSFVCVSRKILLLIWLRSRFCWVLSLWQILAYSK